MRMFLSSYRFGNYADVLLRMLGDQKKVGVITNAKDYRTAEERKESVADLFASFSEIGLEPREIDLRTYFGQADLLEKELEKYGFVWVAGGNTFVLRRALQLSGADNLLSDMVAHDDIFYGGESAGAIIVTPTLEGVEFGDDPYIVPEGYPEGQNWKGLGLVPYSLVPHYESDWDGAERMIEVLEEKGMPYKTLNDSQVLIVEDENGAVLK